MSREERFLQQAIDLSREGMRRGHGGPFGCIIVKGDEVVGKGWNSVTSFNDPTAHAEVVAIRDACNNLGSFQLDGCEIYTSCEPCPMCLGAIYWARPARVYFANNRYDAKDAGFDDSFIYDEINLAPEKRSIKMMELKLDNAKKIFEEWKSKEDKIDY